MLVDGDATYDAPSAPAMISDLIAHNRDMVVAARISQEDAAYRRGHRAGNRLLTGFVASVFGSRFTDILSGYRVFSRRFVKSFPVLSGGFEIETELTVHALELDKRGEALVLPLSGQVMRIPRNLYLIGTMNTADRSISLLDTALRRRFGFIELMPDTSLLSNIVIEGIPLGAWLASLNTRVCEHIGRDARNLQVGHAYFLDGNGPVTTFAKLSRILREDVIPLLQEYCYEDYAALERILGTGLVDAKTQCIQHSLFEEANQADLIQALLAPCPEVATSAQATSRDTAPESDENEDEGDTDEQSNGKT